MVDWNTGFICDLSNDKEGLNKEIVDFTEDSKPQPNHHYCVLHEKSQNYQAMSPSVFVQKFPEAET